MEVRNADGSRPEACGNGLRCVVRYLQERGGLDEAGRVVVQTDAGPRSCRACDDGMIEAEMGLVRPLDTPGLDVGVALDVGNPHPP